MMIGIPEPTSLFWLTVLPVVGIFGAVASLFGASKEKKAVERMIAFLRETRERLEAQARQLEQRFQPAVDTGLGQLQTAFARGEDVFRLASLGFQEGLTPADRLALEEGQRLLNENLAATGNLRSGAAAILGAELGRRVLADAANRRLNFLQLGLSAGQLLSGIGGTTARIGLGGLEQATNLRLGSAQQALAEAQGIQQLGRIQAAQAHAFGQLADAAVGFGLGAEGFGGLPAGFGGALLGSLVGGAGIGRAELIRSIAQAARPTVVLKSQANP